MLCILLIIIYSYHKDLLPSYNNLAFPSAWMKVIHMTLHCVFNTAQFWPETVQCDNWSKTQCTVPPECLTQRSEWTVLVDFRMEGSVGQLNPSKRCFRVWGNILSTTCEACSNMTSESSTYFRVGCEASCPSSHGQEASRSPSVFPIDPSSSSKELVPAVGHLRTSSSSTITVLARRGP